ncbi:MAG: hypothetical protein DWQ05_18835 [Calditrichaeota bacterium]|nr:MAG: hypothetical protein DWQ05_18835 [Calditrichota bacterium]
MRKSLLYILLPGILLLAIMFGYTGLIPALNIPLSGKSSQEYQLNDFEIRYLKLFDRLKPEVLQEHETELLDPLAATFRENPFLKPDFDTFRFDSEENTQLNAIRLQGILWDKTIRRAIINETVVKPGDRLGQYKIVEINPDNVVVQDEMGAIVLNLTKTWTVISE